MKIKKITKTENAFKPITIQITLETKEEFYEMWHRMNSNWLHDEYRKRIINEEAKHYGMTLTSFTDKVSYPLFLELDKHITCNSQIG